MLYYELVERKEKRSWKRPQYDTIRKITIKVTIVLLRYEESCVYRDRDTRQIVMLAALSFAKQQKEVLYYATHMWKTDFDEMMKR